MRLRRRRLVWNEVVRQVGVGRDDDVAKVTRLVLPLDVGDVAHHDVDEGVLDQTQEHENCAATHKYVDGLKIDMRACKKGHRQIVLKS